MSEKDKDKNSKELNKKKSRSLSEKVIRSEFSNTEKFLKIGIGDTIQASRLSNQTILGMSEPVRKMQEHISKSGISGALHKSRQNRYAIIGISEPVRKMQEHILKSGVRDALQASSHSKQAILGMSEFLRKMQEHIIKSGVRDAIISSGFSNQALFGISGAIQRLQEQVLKTNVNHELFKSRVSEQLLLHGLSESIQKMQEHILKSALYHSSHEKLTKDHFISTSINRINEISSLMSLGGYDFEPNGTIVAEGVSYGIDEIQGYVSKCIEESITNSTTDSIEGTINNYLEVAAKQNPLVTKILVYIILPIIINIFTGGLSPQDTQTTIKQNNTIIIKSIKNEVRKSLPSQEIISMYRFVSCKHLKVMEGNSTKSRSLGKLSFGQVVTIVTKKRNWTLVEYRKDESGVIIKGWVFTRYLEKFK